MEDWADLLFYKRSRGGLIATEANWSNRKVFTPLKEPVPGKWENSRGVIPEDPSSWWERLPAIDENPASVYGIVETRDASSIKSLHLMYEFLSWLPPDRVLPSTDRSLLEHCTEWARAFMRLNQGGYGGHDAGGWALYNFVHTGPPKGTPLDTADFELQLRFALEGIPDSWWVLTLDYGILAQAFVLLSEVTGVSDYAEFAANKNAGLWNSRFKPGTYLMPDTVTPRGPLPGDPGGSPDRKYQSDTDCLYWALAIFDAYQLVGTVREDLRPGDLQNVASTLASQTRLRRRNLESLGQDQFPELYLRMALGLTLDWIRFGWKRPWRHFVRKMYHDGARSTDAMYGDGKYNTLRMLVSAYRATHDDFYLNIFDQAWERLEEFAADERLAGLFPASYEAGNLPALPVQDSGQEAFIDFVTNAYTATVAAGQPKQQYLERATRRADALLRALEGGTEFKCTGHAFVRLALAPDSLRRIEVSVWEDAEALIIVRDAMTVEIARSGRGVFRHAVVYMDPGVHQISYRRPDLTVSTSHELTVGDRTVSVRILENDLLIGEEDFA
jgi:hypothetical protein